jgi:hypothetical protein
LALYEDFQRLFEEQSQNNIALYFENDNAELIALHVIHSQIKHVSSTSYGGSVNQKSIDGIIEHAKKEAQTCHAVHLSYS